VGCRCGRECPDRYNYAEQRDYLFALWDALDLGDNVTLVLQWRAFPTAEASKAREWIVEKPAVGAIALSKSASAAKGP
jgi:hypothetical protein